MASSEARASRSQPRRDRLQPWAAGRTASSFSADDFRTGSSTRGDVIVGFLTFTRKPILMWKSFAAVFAVLGLTVSAQAGVVTLACSNPNSTPWVFKIDYEAQTVALDGSNNRFTNVTVTEHQILFKQVDENGFINWSISRIDGDARMSSYAVADDGHKDFVESHGFQCSLYDPRKKAF